MIVRTASVKLASWFKRRLVPPAGMKVMVAAVGSTMLLAGCATQPSQTASTFRAGAHFDPRLGVSASDKVVADSDPVPRGGGSYLTGRPYVIAGKAYVPRQSADGYTAVGTASWYGDAFHGRRTANGEIFDKGSVSAAHPTLPLPSYVRVTNLVNGRSMIVRVNDRGPYHGGRVMDVSQRVAETLDFRRAGTAHVRIDYVGKATLGGADDAKLMATLRTDGGAAQLGGAGGSGFTALAGLTTPDAPATPAPRTPPQPSRVARLIRAEEPDYGQSSYGKASEAPLPPSRPFEMTGSAEGGESRFGRRSRWRERVAATVERR